MQLVHLVGFITKKIVTMQHGHMKGGGEYDILGFE